MNNLSSRDRSCSEWASTPVLSVSHCAQRNEYRLSEGRVEFRAAGDREWRRLAYSEIQQHMVLGTAVASWLSQLYTTATLAQVLCN